MNMLNKFIEEDIVSLTVWVGENEYNPISTRIGNRVMSEHRYLKEVDTILLRVMLEDILCKTPNINVKVRDIDRNALPSIDTSSSNMKHLIIVGEDINHDEAFKAIKDHGNVYVLSTEIDNLKAFIPRTMQYRITPSGAFYYTYYDNMVRDRNDGLCSFINNYYNLENPPSVLESKMHDLIVKVIFIHALYIYGEDTRPALLNAIFNQMDFMRLSETVFHKMWEYSNDKDVGDFAYKEAVKKYFEYFNTYVDCKYSTLYKSDNKILTAVEIWPHARARIAKKY